jgi:large subunit ribosomal protein L31
MKKDIHPVYRDVVFRDVSANFEILTRSTIKTTDKTSYQGKEYPLFKVDISSASHPFYTGTQRMMDTEGRVDRFKKKYAKK